MHAPACGAGRVACDLPAAPRPGAPGYGRPAAKPWARDEHGIWLYRGWRRSACRWDWVDVLRTSYRRYFPGVPGWYIHHRWTGPQRVAVRDLGRRAVAEYRATGDVDVVMPTDQHHHSTVRDWC